MLVIVAGMDVRNYYFTEEHALFRESLRAFLDREVVPHIEAWEAAGELPRAIWHTMADMGYFGLGFDAAWGGSALDFFYGVVFIEEVTKCRSGGFGAAICLHPFIALEHIARQGSDDLKERYLRRGIAGELIGALAVTEPNAGSDVAGIATRATRQGDYYVVNGSKTFITNGVLSDFIITACKTGADERSISLLVIDRATPGVSATKLKKLGWHSSDTGEIHFEDVRVPVGNLLGEEGMGFYYIMQRFELERLVMAISGVAISEEALRLTMEYMHSREAFGRRIERFQVLRHRIAQLVAETEQARCFVYDVCRRVADGVPSLKACAMAKLLGTELSDKVITECLQCYGGYGYMEEYPMARLFRDSRIGTIGGGTSEIMREIIAKLMFDNG